MVMFNVSRVDTTPFDGQKPGTSGLRKKVKVFKQPHYLENFVQATFNALGADNVRGATLVVSGDGRYYSKDAIQNGLLSTPAVYVHPSGESRVGHDTLNSMENGGPAPESVTNKIYENTTSIKEYLIAEGLPDVDISVTGVSSFGGPEGQFEVDVFDSATDYEDFGGGHPDPNLTYAKELVERMGLGRRAGCRATQEFESFLLMEFFVTPSDSVAIIAANAVESIPYFSGGLKGVARSMPTSAALDVVANHLNLKFFEVPTGWKFFGNLMDAGMCSVCGEESFGTGRSNNVHFLKRYFSTLFFPSCSVLAFYSYLKKDNHNGDKLVSVEDIVRQHWATYGRHYYTRYDYENVDASGAKDLMANLVNLQSNLDEVNKIVSGIHSGVSNVVNADEFEYKDPVDGSISKHQGIRYLFADGSRLVFRLSGTGSEGATIRLYIEQYEKDSSKIGRESHDALAPLVEVALKLSKMEEFTGRSAPTVIT
ncbi:hypothetical protein Leryth_007710 [Lithospermum erythrorhizon]|nr:hypothetical protein Leryth_007710 [Lithospermum erythrorhizon]